MKELGQNLLQRFWVDGLDKRLPLLVTLAVIVLLTHSMATLTWKLVPVPELHSVGIPASQRTQTAQPARAADQPLARKIEAWHLFGKFEKKKLPPKPKLDVAAAPETRLNLKLRGVFASNDKELARAIIADAKGKDESYAIGDEVPGGAILNDIFPDKVILEHNGKLEILKLPVESAPSRNIASTPNRGRATSQSRSAPTIDTATAETSEILRHYRDALINDPQSLMGLVRVQPYNKNGRLQGYRIRPGKDRKLLSKFGLRSGDIIKSVNGVPLDNPIKALEIMRDLSTATSVSVDVERNGSPKSFTFSVQ